MIRTKSRARTACRVVYDAPGGPCLTGRAGQLVPVSSPLYDDARAALAQAWEARPPACTAARAEYETAVMRPARAAVRAAWLATAEQWGIDPDPL